MCCYSQVISQDSVGGYIEPRLQPWSSLFLFQLPWCLCSYPSQTGSAMWYSVLNSRSCLFVVMSLKVNCSLSLWSSYWLCLPRELDYGNGTWPSWLVREEPIRAHLLDLTIGILSGWMCQRSNSLFSGQQSREHAKSWNMQTVRQGLVQRDGDRTRMHSEVIRTRRAKAAELGQ